MAKQGVNKKYSVSASGVLNIENGILTISVEDIGDFRLDVLLRDFDGCPIKPLNDAQPDWTFVKVGAEPSNPHFCSDSSVR